MKQPIFDLKQAHFDMYNDFYIPHGPGSYQSGSGSFIQFNSGEVIVLNRSWQPDQRKHYSDLNIAIFSTADDRCPLLHRPDDKRRVPKTHLNYAGQQILLIDYDHNLAVSIDHDKRRKHTQPLMPERFNKMNVAAYYRGPLSPPVGQSIVIEYAYPFTPEQHEHLNDLKMACEAWFKMSKDWTEQQRRIFIHDHRPASMLGALHYTFSELGDNDRAIIALVGYDRGTKIETHDYLTIADS